MMILMVHIHLGDFFYKAFIKKTNVEESKVDCTSSAKVGDEEAGVNVFSRFC